MKRSLLTIITTLLLGSLSLFAQNRTGTSTAPKSPNTQVIKPRPNQNQYRKTSLRNNAGINSHGSKNPAYKTETNEKAEAGPKIKMNTVDSVKINKTPSEP